MKKQKLPKREVITTAAGTTYLCYVSSEPDGGHVVTSPGVPPLGAYGEKLEAARVSARMEIEAWEQQGERLRDHYSALCYDGGL